MFTANTAFSALAMSHYGHDGGNLAAPLWVSGIEWGGGISPVQLLADIRNGPREAPRSTVLQSERDKYAKYNFDRVWLKLLARSLGHSVTDYRNMLSEEVGALTATGPILKLNLYPISFKNTYAGNWSKEFYELTGFPTKELYMAWVQTNRFKFFNDLVAKHRPKIIVCSGSSYKRDYLLAFGGIDSLFSEPKQKILLSTSKEVLIYPSSLASQTEIYIVPFFGGIHGIKSDAECEELGTLLHRALGVG